MIEFNGIKSLIFDLDGTLIDSSDGVIEATNYALNRIGEPPRRSEEIVAFIGYPLETMFKAFSQKSYKEFWMHFQKKGKGVIAASAKPIGNAGRILKELKKRGYAIGIGTTKMRVHVEQIIRNLGWSTYVDTYVGADDVAEVKPAPDAFLETLKRLEGRPESCVVIGDTINDVIAAKRAGLKVIAVKSIFGDNGKLQAGNPDLIVDSLDEILRLLK